MLTNKQLKYMNPFSFLYKQIYSLCMNRVTLLSYRSTMWWTVLFLIVAAAADSDYEHSAPSCRSMVSMECENDAPTTDFPGTEEELEEVCKFLSKYFECVNRVLETCEEDEEGTIMGRRHFQELDSNHKRVCDKDSLLYRGLALSISCFKKNYRIIFYCPSLFDENGESFNDTLADLGITDVATHDSDPRRCLNILYGIGCMAANSGKMCDDIARDVVVNIFQGFDTTFETCRPGMKDHLLEIAKVMQLELEKEETVENKIKKKK